MSERSEHGAPVSEPNGLQAERTVLAWTRTVLVVAAVAAVIARTADSGYERGVAIALAAAGLGLAVLTAWRRRRSVAAGDVRSQRRIAARSVDSSQVSPPSSPPASW